MLYLAIKAVVSAVMVVVVSEVAARYPAWGGWVASLPLVSVLAMIWLWHGGQPTEAIARHSTATFWFVLPSLPMFLCIPYWLNQGVSFWPAMGMGCGVTVLLYLAMGMVVERLGV